MVHITDIAVVDGEVCRTEHSATLATGIDITLDGGHAAIEAEVGKVGRQFFSYTYHHIRITLNVTIAASADGTYMLAYATFPTATIDITYRTAENIGIRHSSKGS